MAKADGASGSGFAGPRADAIALLAAGLLTGNTRSIRDASRALDREHGLGNSPLSAAVIHGRLAHLLLPAFRNVRSARPLPSGGAGDLEIITPTEHIYVEVKAQLEKQVLTDITQADWVRNETDALRYLFVADNNFRRAISPQNQALLDSDPDDLRGWDFASLWLADVALITNASLRGTLQIRTPTDLAAFMARKYLLHMSAHDDQLVRLSELPPVAHAIQSRAAVTYTLNTRNRSEVAIPVTVAGSRTVFTYHVYAPTSGQAKGRHKVHAWMFDEIEPS